MEMNRRNWLKNLGTIAAFSALPSVELFAGQFNPVSRNRTMRIAHITDVHLHDKDGAPQLFEKCLHHIQQLNPAPDLIINGGDAINDALFHTRTSVQKQWKTWHSLIQNECCLPIEHCIGNHDVWGMTLKKSDPLYGKGFAMEMMGLDTTYKSFDLNGWHFIFLDSTHEKNNGIWYTAKLGDEQMSWLEEDLKNTPASTPIMVVSHIPILSASVFLDDYKIRSGKFNIPATWMHTDIKEIMQLFSRHQNIKLCLSGHIHLFDHVEYNNISFFCNGAVSGDWWRNMTYHETKAGYAIVDLFDDGSFINQYTTYLE